MHPVPRTSYPRSKGELRVLEHSDAAMFATTWSSTWVELLLVDEAGKPRGRVGLYATELRDLAATLVAISHRALGHPKHDPNELDRVLTGGKAARR